MNILVTRPEPAATLMAGDIRERGHEALVCPLTRQVPVTFDPGRIGEADGWILTSPRAAQALAGLPQRPVFTVGRASERAAREAGAETVIAGHSDWRELSRIIRDHGFARGSRLVHFAGREVAGNLADELRGAGLTCERVVVYAMERVVEADGLVGEALRRRSVDAVALMSPRAARLFCEIIDRLGLAGIASGLCILALSRAIADAAGPLGARDIRISQKPCLTSLLRQLDGPLDGSAA